MKSANENRKKFLTKEVLITLVLGFLSWGLLVWYLARNNLETLTPFFITMWVLLISTAFICAIALAHYLVKKEALWKFIQRIKKAYNYNPVIRFIIKYAIQIAAISFIPMFFGL
ncbi:hypothetical protein ACFL2V_11370 [Pseudomonadota bacterium]